MGNINDDNSLGRVRKSPNLFSGGPRGHHHRYPLFEIDDIIATRDHFSQALLDQMLSPCVFTKRRLVTLTGYGLKTDQVSFIWGFLRGPFGCITLPIEPDIQNFAFNVGRRLMWPNSPGPPRCPWFWRTS